MVKQDLELARRAVACEGWRWLPGMLAKNVTAGARVLGGKGDRPVLAAIHHYGNGFMLHHLNRFPCDSFPQSKTAHPYLPDLTDPATLGCLIALLRDAHRDAYMAAGNDGPNWVVRDCDGYEVCRGTSERAVLVAALEAAP